MRRSRIEIANSAMDITAACLEVGIKAATYSLGSMKMYCPFGFLHTDGGESKSFRVYVGTNSAYCFAGCGRFSPVRLIAEAKDLSVEDAAEWILVQTGYVEENYQDQWDALMAEQGVPDRDALSDALKIACARMDPQWEDKQFEDDVSKRLVACLALLPKVNDAQQAQEWLSITKQAMSRVLGGTT